MRNEAAAIALSQEQSLNELEEIIEEEMLEEELQEEADIKREELAETPPTPVNGAQAPAGTEIDPKALSLNEKYEVILTQVKQTGPLFFVQVNPTVFALPDNDPLNLIWINILTGWKVASTILAQFERTLILNKDGATADENGNAENLATGTEESAVSTDSTSDEAIGEEALAADSE